MNKKEPMHNASYLQVTIPVSELTNLVEQVVTATIRQTVKGILQEVTAIQSENDLLTREEAARLLNCSTRTVDTLRQRKQLIPQKIGNKSVRFFRKDVLAILNGKGGVNSKMLTLVKNDPPKI